MKCQFLLQLIKRVEILFDLFFNSEFDILEWFNVVFFSWKLTSATHLGLRSIFSFFINSLNQAIKKPDMQLYISGLINQLLKQVMP